ncbi:MAG: sugar ABC transporter permease [Defluviitaleaceae bacterium]|nr:sugar ABC transporter permease [Defluviitaleaceae bacterium]MCL2836099.1 sugar ABC transporter permease [Defluviitaleaceae bacterium]
MNLYKRRNLTGWAFLLPAALMICWMSFWPMAQSFMLSFQTGTGARMRYAEPLNLNYGRIFNDRVFIQALQNNFYYLLIQVPIMLILALILATMLNNKNLKFRGLFRTAIFLPCATSLVSYSMIFRTLFAFNGFINTALVRVGILDAPYNFLTNAPSARIVIIIALIWRWTGYNMVFYLAGLQNIDGNVYEAAKIDGAGPVRLFTRITVPLLRPIILLTVIMSTNGTLQLFDESFNLTSGGPANGTITMSHYLYNVSFVHSANFGYASAISFVIMSMVAVLALIQMKVGDKR